MPASSRGRRRPWCWQCRTSAPRMPAGSSRMCASAQTRASRCRWLRCGWSWTSRSPGPWSSTGWRGGAGSATGTSPPVSSRRWQLRPCQTGPRRTSGTCLRSLFAAPSSLQQSRWRRISCSLQARSTPRAHTRPSALQGRRTWPTLRRSSSMRSRSCRSGRCPSCQRWWAGWRCCLAALTTQSRRCGPTRPRSQRSSARWVAWQGRRAWPCRHRHSLRRLGNGRRPVRSFQTC
mmetsp:Transcript_121395/g.338849  ORF Transcript_121395/g.338849 Transcript_121395/m.338849 type:complete len:233 (-) Transcript_121395:1444-2142(-)